MTIREPYPNEDVDENLILMLREEPPTEVPGGPRTVIQSAQSRAWTMSGDVD